MQHDNFGLDHKKESLITLSMSKNVTNTIESPENLKKKSHKIESLKLVPPSTNDNQYDNLMSTLKKEDA